MDLDVKNNRSSVANMLSRFSDIFVGLEAEVFSYSPGFQDLYVSFKRDSRYFLVKFNSVEKITANTRWLFGGFDIEYSSGSYIVYDRDCFNVKCKNILIVEIVNGEDVFSVNI